MTAKIPEEISCEIGPRGGIDGISKRLPAMKVLDAVALLHGILSDRVRLQLLLALREGGLCVCVLKKLSSCPDTRLSYHLSTLKRAGLVSSKRDRSFLRYSLTERGKKAVDKFLKELRDLK